MTSPWKHPEKQLPVDGDRNWIRIMWAARQPVEATFTLATATWTIDSTGLDVPWLWVDTWKPNTNPSLPPPA